MNPLRAGKLILFFIVLFSLAVVIIGFSSIIGITELVYPVKIDSAYVMATQRDLNQPKSGSDSLDPGLFLFKPEQLDMAYEDFIIKTKDSLLLKGWYFLPRHDESGICLLIIHDISESKITYLEAARAFTERGFRVCCVDMRACGTSQGSYFTMGAISSSDISIILDSLYSKPETRNIAVMGVGTGAAIALQAATYDQRPIAWVIQNSFVSLTAYFSRYARHKWGLLGNWFFPYMKKELDRQMGFNSDSLNLQKIIASVTKPTLFVARAKERIEDLKDTHLLFEISPAEKKEFVFFREQTTRDSSNEQQKAYFDKISAFISTSVPKKEKRTKFKRLVINDHKVNDR